MNDSTDIIFVQTRFDYRSPEGGYGSYHDYYHLVELSNFPIIYTDEIDPTDASKCYIFSPRNGEHEGGWPDAKARIIHWNIEQNGYEPLPGIAETWCSDALLAKQTGARYVVMGSHPGLKPDNQQVAKHFDAILLQYVTPRRQTVIEELKVLGVTMAPNGWGVERHRRLLGSKIMLHIHQNDEKPYLAPQRFCLAAAYSLPVISEMLGDWGLFQTSHILVSSWAHLADFTAMWLKNGPYRPILQDFGRALYQFLCVEHTFRKEVEKAV